MKAEHTAPMQHCSELTEQCHQWNSCSISFIGTQVAHPKPEMSLFNKDGNFMPCKTSKQTKKKSPQTFFFNELTLCLFSDPLSSSSDL